LDETTEYLTEKQKLHILEQKYTSLVELVKNTNFNPKLPQCHNVYVSSSTSGLGHYYGKNKKWNIGKNADVIHDLIEKKKDDIDGLLAKYEDKLPAKTVEKLHDAIEKLEYRPESNEKNDISKVDYQKLIRDTNKFLLYNEREIPQKTRQKIKKTI